MSAVADRLPDPPLPLTPELRADIAHRRAGGRSWEAVGAALKYDAHALRRACATDGAFAPALSEAEANAEREAELKALRRLKRLTDSDDERVALRAAEVLVRYGRDRRRERAEAGRPPVESPTGDARAPAVPDPVPRPTAGHTPKPTTGAFRAVPDLPPGRLAELVRGG